MKTSAVQQNPSRLHYLLSVLELHSFHFCLYTKTKKQPLGVMWCHFLHSALKPLMICSSITRDCHYLETVELQLFFYVLYLQQDHQQFLIVPRGVTTDIFLQLGAKLWKEE